MNELSSTLRRWADRTEVGEPPIAELIAAGHRRRVRRRATAAGTGVLALASAAMITLTTAGTAGTSGTSGSASPTLELAAAVSSTAAGSFRFIVESTLSVPADNVRGEHTTCTGAADPETNTGYLKTGTKLRQKSHPTVPVIYEVRVVRGDLYIGMGSNWQANGKGTLTNLRCGDANEPALLAADPLSQLRQLGRSVVASKTAAGYSFTGDGITGTVTVSDGKVTQLSYRITRSKTHDTPAYSEQVTTKLSGYGQPVAVQKPV